MTAHGDEDPARVVLRVRGLGRRHGEAFSLRGVDLEVHRGEAVVLFGHNGSGKTTLLDCVAGLLEPTAGEVRVGGASPHHEPEAARARALTAYVDDAPVFYRDLTVREHVELVAVAHGRPDADVDALLEELGVDGHAEAFPHELSAGLQQRAQLACAFVRPHRLLLLDEPTLRLDPAGRATLHRRLRRARRRGAAVVFSTHRPDLAEGLADRAVLLAGGEVVAMGTLEEVLADPQARDLGL